MDSLTLEDDDDWNSKYSFFKVNVFTAESNVICFSPHTSRPGENESLVVILDDPEDTMASQPTLTIQLDEKPTQIEMSIKQRLIVFGHESGLVGVVHFDVSERFHEQNIRIYATSSEDERRGITSLKICNEERSFYVGTESGSVLKFDASDPADASVMTVLDLQQAVAQISLSSNDSCLVVTAEEKVAICQTILKTYVEVKGTDFVGAQYHNDVVYCAKSDSLIWQADINTGSVENVIDHDSKSSSEMTLTNESKKIELLKSKIPSHGFEKVWLLNDKLVTCNSQGLYVADPSGGTVDFLKTCRSFGILSTIRIDASNLYLIGYNGFVHKLIFHGETTGSVGSLSDGKSSVNSTVSGLDSFKRLLTYGDLELPDREIAPFMATGVDLSAAKSLISEKIGSGTKKLIMKTSEQIKKSQAVQESLKLFDEMYEEHERLSDFKRLRQLMNEQSYDICSFAGRDFRVAKLPQTCKSFLQTLETLEKAQEDFLFTELTNAETDLLSKALTFIVTDELLDECDIKCQTSLPLIEGGSITLLETFGADLRKKGDEKLVWFIQKYAQFLNLEKIFSGLDLNSYCLWKAVLDAMDGDAVEDPRLRILKDMTTSSGILFQSTLSSLLENLNVVRIPSDLIFMAVSLSSLNPDYSDRILFESFSRLHSVGKKEIPITDKMKAFFINASAKESSSNSLTSLEIDAPMSEPEQFVFDLTEDLEPNLRLLKLKELKMWLGYFQVLTNDLPFERRFEELETLLKFKSPELLAKSGFFDSASCCEAVVKARMTMGYQDDSILSLENLLLAIFKVVDSEEAQILMHSIIKQLPKGILSARFYRMYISMFLKR